MELTKAEEQILHYLWKLEEATVQDILSCMDDAGKPSRTTVSTIIRILENKGAVSHKTGTASFFAKESNMTAEELDVLLEDTRRKLKNEKGKE